MSLARPLVRRSAWLAALGCGLLACGESEAPPLRPIRFVDVAREVGIQFEHERGATETRYQYETLGAGAVWFDFDGDGRDDLFLVQSGVYQDDGGNGGFPNALYRTVGEGRLELQPESGLESIGYGMGATAFDFDGDGDLDVFVTCYGPNRLYRNEGGGRFTEVGQATGLADPGWGMAAASADFDGDGWPDLYVVNYVVLDRESYPFCGDLQLRRRAYCHPEAFAGQTDRLYRNRGDGTFEDVTETSAVGATAGKGMGVVCADLDGDRDVDIFVANDTVENLLFRNDGEGRFTEVALGAGVAVNGNGLAEACMGIAADDFDGDQDIDLFVTNFASESNTLYRNVGGLSFEDATQSASLSGAGMPWVGFGTRFVDYDNDGRLDLVVVNGHIQDQKALIGTKEKYRQPMLVFRQRSDRSTFVNVTGELGDVLSRPIVGRDLTVADYDSDGDLDLLVTVSAGPPRLLRNEGSHGRFFRVRLQDERGHWPVGAAVVVTTGSGRVLWRPVVSGQSYMGQSESVVHFGLGDETRVESVEIRWPGGESEHLPGGPVDRVLVHRRDAADR